jgi:hypothetical protein
MTNVLKNVGAFILGGVTGVAALLLYFVLLALLNGGMGQ